jgi:transcriptional regulator with XRE-family HTH domain
MELSRVLKKLMYDRDIKLVQVSRATKVPLTTLSNWMAGQKPRDVNQIKLVADYFKVSLDFILFNIQPSKQNIVESMKDEINAGAFEVILRPIKKHTGTSK